MYTAEVAIAKTHKYATRDSGDTAEIVERPGGGLSVVLIDAQGSGAPARLLSTLLTGKAAALLKEGVRDGVVARATSDALLHLRGGQVSATLEIISLDLASQTIVLCRNSHCPLLLHDASGLHVLRAAAGPIGLGRQTRPEVRQIPIAPGTRVVAVTDGIVGAGERQGRPLDLPALVGDALAAGVGARCLADDLLAAALAADQGRPGDDMAVVVLAVVPAPPAGPAIRRMAATLPLPGAARRP